MRLRNVPGADAYLTAHPLVIKNETRYRGTWKETFQNPENPIHIEIGMGKGQFLLTLAKENPSINYIGIERYSSVLLRALERFDNDEEYKDVNNIRFITVIFDKICCYGLIKKHIGGVCGHCCSMLRHTPPTDMTIRAPDW